MLFQSWIFLVFFIVVFGVYMLVKATRLRVIWLLIASYAFYAWWEPYYVILLIFSAAIDYWVVKWMENSSRKKVWVAVSIVSHLGLLGFFKYGVFFTNNLNAFFDFIGINYQLAHPGSLFGGSFKYVLPVGISFYTFQAISYTIDFYRGQIERERSFIRFAAFVSLFPRLLAGPIERAKNFLPQLHTPARITRLDITDGLSLFVVGLFKKIAIADYLAQYVNTVYDAPGRYQSPALILATFAFAWQIYFDFSGYTDMARGVARVFGFRLMLNFNNPYLATGLTDFWRRWHISLSTWFRDYVYIPLGGNRRGRIRTYVNVFITMVISGFWHGASWNFIIWGALHGIGCVLTRKLERSQTYREKIPKFVKQIVVFIFVLFAWIFFRAATTEDAWLIITRIFGSGLADPAFPLLAVGLIFSMWTYAFICESRAKWVLQSAPVRVGLVVLMLLYMSIFVTSGQQPFIYLQF